MRAVQCSLIVAWLLAVSLVGSAKAADIELNKHKEIIRLFYFIEEGRLYDQFIEHHLASRLEGRDKSAPETKIATDDFVESTLRGFKPNYLNRAMLAYAADFSFEELRTLNKQLSGKSVRSILLYFNEQHIDATQLLSEEETFALMQERFGDRAVRSYRQLLTDPAFAKLARFHEKITPVRRSFLDEVWAAIDRYQGKPASLQR